MFPGLIDQAVLSVFGLDFDFCYWIVFLCSARVIHMTTGGCAIGKTNMLELLKSTNSAFLTLILTKFLELVGTKYSENE